MNPVLALLLIAATLPGERLEVAHVDAGLTLDGELLAVDVADADGRPGNELTVAVYDRGTRRRELRVFHLGPEGRDPEPWLSVPVKADVLAWAWADVRPEPGPELIFLTRSGAWAYAPAGQGYRDILKLVDTELLYDVADSNVLPRWPYVLRDGQRDALLLPGPEGYTIWRAGGEAGRYRADSRIAEEPSHEDSGADSQLWSMEVTAGGIRLSGSLRGRLAPHAEPGFVESTLVSAETRIDAPALLDVDGDGRIDLVRARPHALLLHLGDARGIPAQPTRKELLPPLLVENSGDTDLRLHDLDGDGDLDLLAILRDDRDETMESNHAISLVLMLNDGRRLLHEHPDQVLKFEAAEIRPDVADVDGDGLPDLVISKVLGPSLLELTSPEGLKLTRSMLVFLGQGEGRFSRRPDIQRKDVYDSTRLGDAIVQRSWRMDLDGDGLADLVDTDLAGNTLVSRLVRHSSFFGGESWELERTPWRRFEGLADMATMRVEDFNGDGLGDVLSYRGGRLTLLLSQRVEGRR